MAAITQGQSMGRPKKGQGDQPPTVAVKIDRAIVARAKMIAADRGIDTATYLSEALRSVVEKDWLKVIRKAAGDQGKS